MLFRSQVRAVIAGGKGSMFKAKEGAEDSSVLGRQAAASLKKGDVVVGVAAFNLVLDFDTIERAAAARAPKSMEWYGAFGLLVTLVWLYLELLRLLSKLQGNRR